MSNIGTKRRSSAARKRALPYLYMLPAIVFFIVFKYGPMIFGFVLSFFKWNFIGAMRWVGLSNYAGMFNRELFIIALKNTVGYTVALLPFQIILPLVLAMLILQVSRKGVSDFFKVTMFMPSILSFSITCMVWMWVFNPSFGSLNAILGLLGLKPQAWLNDENLAFWSIVLVSGWKSFGYNMIIFIAGLSAISEELVEAAMIDGATPWQIFWKVKWPLLGPTTFFVFITSLIFAADKAFVPINILTQGGPHNVTTNLAHAIYLYGFQVFNLGLANSVSIFTFLLFLLMTFLSMKVMGRRINYEI